MAVAFSSDGSDIINRKLNLESNPSDDVCRAYNLDECVKWIKANSFKRVALQFPDSLLPDACGVEGYLKKQCDAQLFILADTAYGSCCVDEVAAEHYHGDSVIHFGPACLSPTRRLPVYYVFNKMPVDCKDCVHKFIECCSEEESCLKIGLLYDVTYAHAAVEIYTLFKMTYPHLVLSKLDLCENVTMSSYCEGISHSNNKQTSDNDYQYVKCGPRTLTITNEELEQCTMFYIGSESLTLTNLIMNWNKCTFYSYNPESKICRKERVNVNKALMKRFYLVERIKDAAIVGILIGTLGVANYMQVLNRIKKLLRSAGKKYYTFVVGKLNVAKLANFMEIDVYVYVSCPENSLVDSTDFYRPIVTPYEVELACNPSVDWTGQCVTDFQQLLPGGASYTEIPDTMTQQSTTDVSLVTGGMRKLGIDTEVIEEGMEGRIVERNPNLQVAMSGNQSASEFLHRREWKGLEMNLGKTPVTKATEGRRGIAIAYEEEPKTT